jgi:adenylate kinase
MKTAEIIQELRALPSEERRLVLRQFLEDIEEVEDTALFDTRSTEPDALTLHEVL